MMVSSTQGLAKGCAPALAGLSSNPIEDKGRSISAVPETEQKLQSCWCVNTRMKCALRLECVRDSSSLNGEQRSCTASPVRMEVLWEVLLHKVTAGGIIIEADLMAGVEPAPGLHHGEHC